MFGNAHFTTFDNKTYTYYSGCGHVLVDVAPNENIKDPLEVVIMPDGFCDPTTMCQKKLSLTIGGKAIVLGKREEDGTFSVLVDGAGLADYNLPYTDGEVSIEVREGEKLLFHVFIRTFRSGYVARLGQLDKHRSSERKADGSNPIGPKRF